MVLLGVCLLIAGIIGFASSYSGAHEGDLLVGSAGSTQEDGFLPISLPLEHLKGAPTLQPSTTPEMAGGETSTPANGQGQATPTPTPTPTGPLVPDRIVIPSIELDAPVIAAVEKKVKIGQSEYLQYLAPDEFAAGWHSNSAPLGEVGNTVINGHHNVHGKVFGHLVDLVPGDRILVYSGTYSFYFEVSNVMILPERDADLSTRLDNARWIEPSNDIRLTLVTCWPANSNTHRLIIVASPLPESLDRIDQK